MGIGAINFFSLIYLSLAVTLLWGINDNDTLKGIIKSTLRRWLKLMIGLGIIALIVAIMTNMAQR